MTEALSLQLALHRRQSALIARTLGEKEPAFRRYEARYRRRARELAQVLSREALFERALASDVLHVGDYHTLPQAQALYVDVVRRAQGTARPLVLALECLEGRFQPLLDRWQAGAIDADSFFEQLEAARPDALALWPRFRALLTWAVAQHLPILAIDLRTRGREALSRRDTFAAARIVEGLEQHPGGRVLVLSGQFHVAPCHLPAAVSRALGARAPRVAQRTLFQNCEAPYFELLGRGHDPINLGAELKDGVLCAFSASPTLAQRTFLDYLAAGDVSVFTSEADVHLAVPRLVQALASALEHSGAPDHLNASDRTAGLQVIPAGAPDVLERLRARADVTQDDHLAIAEHLRRGESVYVPSATTVCLTSLSVSDAAREAASHLRHLIAGERGRSDRGLVEAFYARVWEVALCHFGAGLVAPAPAITGLAAWSRSLREGTGELRRVAAFVLAHKALEIPPACDGLGGLAPPRNLRVFHATARALGELLGEALRRSWQTDLTARGPLRALFRDPLDAPQALYVSWIARLAPRPVPRRRSPRVELQPLGRA